MASVSDPSHVPRHLLVMAPGLRHAAGHELDYTNIIADAAHGTGLECTVLLPVDAPPLALHGRPLPLLPARARDGSGFASLRSLIALTRGYYRALTRAETAGVLVFAHTMTPPQVLALLLASAFLPHSPHAVIILLRWPLPSRHRLVAALRLAIGLAGLRTRLRLASDSDLVAADLCKTLGHSVDTIGIPTPHATPPAGTASHLIGYFGACRVSKGIHLLPGLLAAFRRAVPAARFFIQAYAHPDEPPAPAIDALIDDMGRAADVALVTSPLPAGELRSRLGACSIALLPYDATSYTMATSGFFVAAVLARAVILTTDNTWMAHITRTHRLSRVVLVSPDAEAHSLEAAVQRAVALAAEKDQPRPAEQAWMATHTPDAVMRRLLQITEQELPSLY